LIGEFEGSKKELKKLEFEEKSGMSPALKETCLIIGANESYQNAEKDLERLTGIFVSSSTVHELVNKTELEEDCPDEVIEEICVDGGNMSMKSGKYEQFKTSRVNGKWHFARFKEDDKLVEKLQSLNLGKPVLFLGDGHDGVWNVFDEISCKRVEILDWYHLKENLYKQPLEKEKLKEIESLLWKGEKDKAMQQFREGNNFRKYLKKNYGRLINYNYFKEEGLTIGSGAVESSVKQIKSRTNIAGARWSEKGCRKILSLRCYYLNGSYHTRIIKRNLSSKASIA